jgi:ubiquinone biosynthesis protein COQ4
MDLDLVSMIRQLPKLILEPEDTKAAMTFYKAAGGRAISDAMLEHLQSLEEGRRLLSDRPDVFDVLTDRERLRALPPDTLGHRYVAWADRTGIYPEGLVAMGHELGVLSDLPDGTVGYLERRQQVLHDLYHVLTGYQTDPAGEVALLRFSAIQERNRAMSIISFLGQIIFVIHGRFDLFRLRRHASERARRAPLLILQDWEELVSLPLDEVRMRLHLHPAPDYEPLE